MATMMKIRQRVEEADFPSQPGVYVVYEGTEDEQPLYVGVAATQTIAQRWRGQHLRPRSGGSALRRSLGVYLGLVTAKLRRPARYYSPEVEEAVTAFLVECRVDFFPTASADEARALESRLIRELNPRLNVLRG
jgi:excinuclease UvrABC nuclease subunit